MNQLLSKLSDRARFHYIRMDKHHLSTSSFRWTPNGLRMIDFGDHFNPDLFEISVFLLKHHREFGVLLREARPLATN